MLSIEGFFLVNFVEQSFLHELNAKVIYNQHQENCRISTKIREFFFNNDGLLELFTFAREELNSLALFEYQSGFKSFI